VYRKSNRSIGTLVGIHASFDKMACGKLERPAARQGPQSGLALPRPLRNQENGPVGLLARNAKNLRVAQRPVVVLELSQALRRAAMWIVLGLSQALRRAAIWNLIGMMACHAPETPSWSSSSSSRSRPIWMLVDSCDCASKFRPSGRLGPWDCRFFQSWDSNGLYCLDKDRVHPVSGRTLRQKVARYQALWAESHQLLHEHRTDPASRLPRDNLN